MEGVQGMTTDQLQYRLEVVLECFQETYDPRLDLEKQLQHARDALRTLDFVREVIGIIGLSLAHALTRSATTAEVQ
jgi:hypothetical protein